MMKQFIRFLTAPGLHRGLFFLLLLFVSYLSLKPGASVQEEIWLPSAWGLLLDIYDAWKNAFGFGVLGLAAFLGWPQGWGREHWQPRTRKIAIGLCGVLLIALFEGLQYFMPRRHTDLADVIAGGLGIALAGGLSVLLHRWLRNRAKTSVDAAQAAHS
jgi:hypothetical protein